MEYIRIIALVYLSAVNAVSLVCYAADKILSKTRKRRIPESALLIMAAAGGAFGAFLAMQLFRHKTKHRKFTILIPLLLAVWSVLLLWAQSQSLL